MNGIVDLLQPGGLLARGGRDFLHQIGGASDRRHHLVEQTTRFSASITLFSATAIISCAAVCERSASLRTSAATTANPLPCSPARAASIAAFNASKLV